MVDRSTTGGSSRYLGDIGCSRAGDLTVGEEGGRLSKRRHARGKNIHRTKGNVMKSVRLGDALRQRARGEGGKGGGMKDTIYRFPLRASTPRNSASSPRFVSVHLITAIPPPLVPSPFFPEVWRIQEAGGQRREERRRREGSNEWRRRKERMSCLPLEKHDRPIRMDKKAPSLPPFSFFYFSRFS